MSSPIGAQTVAERVAALTRFLDVSSPYLPADRLATARTFADRASARLRLSRRHTVVALVGSTGSGKSSLFNALAQMSLSSVGPLRPTTRAAVACVWAPAGAEPLLDWLDLDPRRCFVRESALDADDQAALRGLVLLDLPDIDSVVAAHRAEADRLLDLTDLLVWVVDPQKYADQLVHESYLRALRPLRRVTVLVLNQVDRLRPADAERCLADLRQLVVEDGMAGAPVLATSAVTGAGLPELRVLLERVVADRRAGLARLAGEVRAVVSGLAPLIGPDDAPDAVRGETVGQLVDDLASASGVEVVTGQAADREAARTRLPGLWRRRRLAGTPPSPAALVEADHAATAVAVRAFAERAGAELPPPWSAAVHAAAGATSATLPNELSERLTAVLAARRRRPGLVFARVVWWVAAVVAAGGLAWLVAHLVAGVVAPVRAGLPDPAWVSIVGAAGALLLTLTSWVAASATRRRTLRRTRRLAHGAVTESVREQVVAPVRWVLHDYGKACAALADAASAGSSAAPSVESSVESSAAPAARSPDAGAAQPARS